LLRAIALAFSLLFLICNATDAAAAPRRVYAFHDDQGEIAPVLRHIIAEENLATRVQMRVLQPSGFVIVIAEPADFYGNFFRHLRHRGVTLMRVQPVAGEGPEKWQHNPGKWPFDLPKRLTLNVPGPGPVEEIEQFFAQHNVGQVAAVDHGSDIVVIAPASLIRDHVMPILNRGRITQVSFGHGKNVRCDVFDR